MLLELGELSRMAEAMGVESVAIGLFCMTVGGRVSFMGESCATAGQRAPGLGDMGLLGWPQSARKTNCHPWPTLSNCIHAGRAKEPPPPEMGSLLRPRY